jgi:predicted TIM-barrel fold metal-dependent hydrolase
MTFREIEIHPMIIDTHCHVIASDTERYPLKPLYGKQSDWSAEHPLDHPTR